MSSQDNQEKEEKGFRIVDKRGGSVEQGEAASSESEQPEQAQEQPEGAEPVEAVDVYGVLRYCIAMLQSHAWQAMGLVPNPLTNKIERNLEQAKVAVDCVGFLVQQLEPKAQPHELPHLRSLLSDLRINFARQKSQPD